MSALLVLRARLGILLGGVLLVHVAACAPAPPAGAGVIDGVLAPCPSSPNCVCSENPGISAYVPPITLVGDSGVAWTKIQASVGALGGKIKKVDQDYLWATFESDLFHFVDDLELRMSPEKEIIHVRSASRVGYSDFGVNGARVRALKEDFLRR